MKFIDYLANWNTKMKKNSYKKKGGSETRLLLQGWCWIIKDWSWYIDFVEDLNWNNCDCDNSWYGTMGALDTSERSNTNTNMLTGRCTGGSVMKRSPTKRMGLVRFSVGAQGLSPCPIESAVLIRPPRLNDMGGYCWSHDRRIGNPTPKIQFPLETAMINSNTERNK